MVGNKYGPADGVAKIMLFVRGFLGGRISAISPVLGIEEFVAEIFERAAVEGSAAGFGFDFDSAGAVATVLCAVIGRENFEFGNGFGVRINVQRGIAAVIHVVAAIEFPVVVFGAAAVHAIADVTVDADSAFILTSLADHTRGDIDKLSEIATVHDEVVDLFAGDSAAQIRGCGFHLGHSFAGHFNGLGDSADGELDVNA